MMWVCDYNHNPICYDAMKCPVCEIREEAMNYNEQDRLEAEVDELEGQVDGLEIEVEELEAAVKQLEAQLEDLQNQARDKGIENDLAS